VRLKKLEKEIKAFKGEAGFELIAKKLGIEMPRKVRLPVGCEPES
jgi:hypothetical protein